VLFCCPLPGGENTDKKYRNGWLGSSKMSWVILALSLGIVAALIALAILWKWRARRVRIASHGGGTVREVEGPSGVYGLDTADLAALRHAARPRRGEWNQDYATEPNTGMPGRVGGIPRSLRVKG